MVVDGLTEVPGVSAEAECPADHWELAPDGPPCHWCGAAV